MHCHASVKGTFLSESTDAFVITPNRLTFFFPETESLNFGHFKAAFSVNKIETFSFGEEKCLSVWNYDKNISTFWKKCTFKFCSSWVSLWLSLKTRSDIFWDLFPVITFWHIFSKWSPWPSMIFSIRLIENPYLVTLVGPWISLLPKTTTIYQLCR